MLAHEFLSLYPAKLAEYCLAITYMLAFVGWWKFVNGGKRAALEARAEAPVSHAAVEAAAPAQWFTVPAGFWIHPGHTWARAQDDGTIEPRRLRGLKSL